MKKNVTGTIDQQSNTYWDKRLQKTFLWDLTKKRLRTSVIKKDYYDGNYFWVLLASVTFKMVRVFPSTIIGIKVNRE